MYALGLCSVFRQYRVGFARRNTAYSFRLGVGVDLNLALLDNLARDLVFFETGDLGILFGEQHVTRGLGHRNFAKSFGFGLALLEFSLVVGDLRPALVLAFDCTGLEAGYLESLLRLRLLLALDG